MGETARTLKAQLAAVKDRSGWPRIYDRQIAERFSDTGGELTPFFAAVASGSPYLARLVSQQADQLGKLLAADPEEALANIFDEADAAAGRGGQ